MNTPVLPALLPLPARPANPMHGSRGRRLRAFKRKHGILTMKTIIRLRDPWLALKVRREDKGKDIATILSESCRIYDEAGLVACATGELTAVRELCANLGIACPL